ncbi:MAG: zinc ribbon domain-containing protein [Thermodesulfobacteriota bacterium]|nr:zinc ribbon domain-containing protein [Thermodesulfobacteriota bacterium]
MKKQIDKRIKRIEAEADEFKVGTISKELYETGEKSSALSHASALAIPFKKAKSAVEQILFMEIPVKSDYTNVLHLAQPFSHYGFALHDYPLQLSCVASGKIPSTLLGISEGFIREFKYVSELEENDPLIPLLEQDSQFKELRDSAFVWKQYLDENEQFSQNLKWGFQIAPLNENEVVCTINTGTELEGVFKKKRIYDLHLRLLVLDALVKNVQRLRYHGKMVKSESHVPVYEMMRRELYPASVDGGTVRSEGTEQTAAIFCPKCGARLSEGMRFCSNCGGRVR